MLSFQKENLPEKERLTYSKYAHNSLAFVAVASLLNL